MIKSPCIGVCEFDSKKGICNGCKRNEFEIFNWMYFSEEQKKEILLEIDAREKLNCKT